LKMRIPSRALPAQVAMPTRFALSPGATLPENDRPARRLAAAVVDGSCRIICQDGGVRGIQGEMGGLYRQATHEPVPQRYDPPKHMVGWHQRWISHTRRRSRPLRGETLEPRAMLTAPVAADDYFETPQDTSLTIDPASLVANDSDADNDSLQVALALARGPFA